MKKILYLTFLFSMIIFGQDQQKIDSITNLLKNAKKDSSRVIILDQLWRYSLYNNTVNAKKFANEMITFSKSINYPNGVASGHLNLGIIASQNSDFDNSQVQLKKALTIFRENGLEKKESIVFSNIAVDYFYQSKYDHHLANEKDVEPNLIQDVDGYNKIYV